MIRHIVFDLDNTLYSVRYGLEEEVTKRVKEFVKDFLGLPFEETKQQWEEGYKKHGTTIGWLVSEKGFMDYDAYYEHLHPANEADSLPPDPSLRKFLESLPCPSSILTNAPQFHANRILEKLKLEGIFVKIYDIIFCEMKGKPYASAFGKVLEDLKLKPEEVLFIDDIPRNVEAYLKLGGRGVLLDETGIHKDYPNERIKSLWELLQFLG